MSVLVNELTDTVWSPYKINRTEWSIYANSEQNKEGNDEGPASHIIDGLVDIIWHSRYNTNNQKGHDDRSRQTDPFLFTIDLGEETIFKAFSYMPRPKAANGRFRHYEFYYGQTTEELYMKIHDNDYLAKGDIDKSKEESTIVMFSTYITARYVSLLSLNNDTFATCTEFNLYEDTPTSDDNNDYINKDKTTNDIPEQIVAGSDNVKEISACHFTNINLNDKKYYIRAASEFMMYDNIFENTDNGNRPGVLYINYNGKLGISNCKFIKIRASQDGEGYVYNCNTGNNINLITEKSEFINCGAKGERPLITIMSTQSSVKFIDCKFIFDSIDGSCRVLELGTNDGVLDNCQFIRCGESSIYLTKNSGEENPVGVFQLTNNYIKSNQGRFVNGDKIRAKPIISGNIFEDSSLDNNYLICLTHNQEEIKLTNNTFSGITVGGSDESNCGGITKIVASSSISHTICYEDCKFYEINKNIGARNIQYYHGAIQYNNIDTNLEINKCVFKESNAKQHGGAVSIRNSKKVNIMNCTFESNTAEYGGALFIHSSSVQDLIFVERCIFTNNVATKTEANDDLFGGSAILLYGAVGVIRKCKFSKNEIKIVDIHESANSLILPLEKSSFKVTECTFSIDKKSMFSIFFLGGNRKTTLELEKCVFNGDLSNNAYFIDGKLIDKKLNKLIIKDCLFTCKLNKALNPKSKFDLVESNNMSMDLNKLKFVFVISAFGIAVVAVLIATLLKKKSRNYSDDHDEKIEMKTLAQEGI